MGSERRSSARLSMNTMLKDARIFDEDSSESEISRIKKEVKTEPSLEDARNKLSMVIKMELNEDATVQIKKEKDVKIKQEVFDEETNTFDNVFGNINLKKEITDQLKSPMKVEYDENSSNSCETNSRKTFKRAVLSKESPYKRKVRESPYKVPNSPLTSNSNAPQSGPSNSRRETLRKRKISEMEQDPEVLSRRQKQIDYGKNTIGYDTYIQAVPRSQRAENDPQTPNKHNKYSRRGWDGLIKQWRLKLHKYDPAETENP